MRVPLFFALLASYHGFCRVMRSRALLASSPTSDKLAEETQRRQENGDRLTAGLAGIPGIQPVRLPENSRAVWHLYPFRYDPAQFHGLPRGRFVHALRAEGIPCGGGYQEQYYDGLLDEAIHSRGFQRLFPPARLKAYRDSFQELRGNKQVCETTATRRPQPRKLSHFARLPQARWRSFRDSTTNPLFRGLRPVNGYLFLADAGHLFAGEQVQQATASPFIA